MRTSKRRHKNVNRGEQGPDMALVHRTSAYFSVEPVDLASGGYTVPYYRREMSVLDKRKAEPGLTVDEILSKYTDWEREEVYPPLNPVNVGLMLDELAGVNYIELRDGKVYPGSKG
jgi:hypothetical protein